MKRAQDVLQGKTMDSRDFVVEILTAETGLPKPGIHFVGGCVGVRNAGYPSRSIPDEFNTVEELGDDDAGFTTAGTRDDAHMPRFSDCRTLLIG